MNVKTIRSRVKRDTPHVIRMEHLRWPAGGLVLGVAGHAERVDGAALVEHLGGGRLAKWVEPAAAASCRSRRKSAHRPSTANPGRSDQGMNLIEEGKRKNISFTTGWTFLFVSFNVLCY